MSAKPQIYILLFLPISLDWLAFLVFVINYICYMIYKQIKFTLLLFVLTIFNLPAQDSLYTRKVINILCSKKLAGRGYIKNGLDMAAKFIVDELKKAKVNPLFGTGFYQWFDFNVNTFPGKMDVKINGKVLKPGVDFIVSEDSKGAKESIGMNKVDSVTYVQDVEDAGPIIKLKKKLTFSVAQDVKPYCSIELLDNNYPKKFKLDINIENKFLTKYLCKNICAFVNGKDTKNDTVIMLTAHYDHLGMMGNKTYFPGANDNASGVSMLLNLVKYYVQHLPKYKTVFVFFAGEEAGLLGSKYFVDNPPIELGKIKFLINLDLLGTGDEGITVVNATEFKPQFELLKRINEEKNYLPLIKPRGKAHNSDHYWFTEKGVPSFFIYTMGGIKAYHDVYDVAKTLPLTKYKAVFNLLTDFIELN